MRTRPRTLAAAVMAGVLLWSAVKALDSAVRLARAPRTGERTGLVAPANTPVRASTPELGRIAGARRAIVFLYSPDCAVCHANMANWVDLVAELRGGPVRLFAVAPVSPSAARAYLGGLSRDVEVVTGTPAQVYAALRVGSTPATLLVENGAVTGRVSGSLTEPARRQIRAFASRAPS